MKRKQVFANVVAATIEQDLRLEYPGDPSLADAGRVHRHTALGGRIFDPAAAKSLEDKECLAGMHDPAELLEKWPSLWETMATIAPVLLEARGDAGAFWGLAGCVGASPARLPPTALEIRALRGRVAARLGVTAAAAELTHKAAPCKYNIVAAVQDACADPDVELRRWLADGAPMGITEPIVPGGLFPRQPIDAEISPEEVFEERFAGNHPSFAAAGADGPGLDVIRGHLNAGFGELFEDRAAAERHFGHRIAPAPHRVHL